MFKCIKNKKKKGFTLIELLAVIVLIGVVTLLATTGIMGSVRRSQRKAFLNSAEQFLTAIKREEMVYGDDDNYEEISLYEFPTYRFSTLDQQPDAGYIVRNDNGEYRVSIWSNKLKVCAYKDFNESLISISSTITKKGKCIAVNPENYIDEDDLGPDEYQIAFHGNSGKDNSTNATMFVQKFTFDNEEAIQANPFTKDKYDFVGWNTNKNATGNPTYLDQALMLKADSGIKTYHLYAQWKVSSSILLSGAEFNSKLKSIANNSTVNWYTADNTIQGFEKSSTAPDVSLMTSDHEISVSGTRFPVYAWFDTSDNKIKWWSDSLDVRLNETSTNLFSNMKKLKSASLVGMNAEDVKSFASLFAQDVELISFDFTGLNTPSLTTMASMFESCQKITSIDVSMLDTHNVTNMEKVFNNAKLATSINVSGWDTRKVENMVSMFGNCQSIQSIDLSSFYDTNLVNMASMFSGCKALTSVQMPHFETKKVTNMYAIFANCTSIEHIDLSRFNSDRLTMINAGFQGDTKLKTVDMSNLRLHNSNVNFRYTFKSCPALTTIYVPSTFDSTKVATDNDVFTGASSLVGGSGTAFVSGNVSSEYARIDDPTNNKPGYFTVK